ncbi:MAG: F0F1 ATP synthase subunit B [Flavobacterium sp.]|nr:F0F1 ATP synthase subunit B [Flavobacterium sp.]
MILLSAGSELINPGIGLIFWMLVTFVILLILLKKYAWKPILGAVSEREEGIRSALLSADMARKEMQNLQADNKRILQEARAERDLMLKEAREMREKMIAESKLDAQTEGARMIEQAKTAIESEKNAAMAQLKEQVSSLSVEIAERILRDELSNKERQMELVDRMLGDAKLN